MKKKIQLLLSGCAVLTVAACISAEHEASEDEKNEAMMAYQVCLHKAAVKLDDGRSDARTIAVAIKPLCVREFSKSVKLSGSGLNPQARNMFEERVQENQVALGTTAVLDERKNHSSN